MLLNERRRILSTLEVSQCQDKDCGTSSLAAWGSMLCTKGQIAEVTRLHRLELDRKLCNKGIGMVAGAAVGRTVIGVIGIFE